MRTFLAGVLLAAVQALDELRSEDAIEYVIARMPIPLANDQLTLLHRNQYYGVFRIRQTRE